jgi:DNA-binding protein YbaB
MPFTTPNAQLQTSARQLLEQLQGFENDLEMLEFQASDVSGSVTATITAEPLFKNVTVAPAVLTNIDLVALQFAASTAIGKALRDISDEARARMKLFARDADLPGLLGGPPLHPDEVGFREGVCDLTRAATVFSDDVSVRFSGEAADGKVRVVVDGLLMLVDVELDPSLTTSVDRFSLGQHLVDAGNAALDNARLEIECVAANRTAIRSESPISPEMRPTALFVTGASTLNLSDQLIKARLAGLGFKIVHKTGPAVQLTDTTGTAIVIISESTSSGTVEDRLNGTTVPMLVLEPGLWDNLKLTLGGWQTDFGDISNVNTISISNPSHPLAGGVPAGSQTIATSASKIVWGKPTNQATVVATVDGDPTRATIFAYETGASMHGMNAPARRVAFFAGENTPANLNSQGWALFDAAVDWATKCRVVFVVRDRDLDAVMPEVRPRVVLVTNNLSLNASDSALQTRLSGVGFQVIVRRGVDVTASDLSDVALVVVSESTESESVGERLTNVQTPMIVLEPELFDALKMTGAGWQTELGDVSNQTQIVVSNSGTPLAARFSGTITATSTPSKLVWGKPSTGSIKVAHVVGFPDRYTVFGYEEGSDMVGLVAPARRVGWFAGRDTVANLTESGWRLFDAAVGWAIANQASDSAILSRLVRHFGFEVTLVTDVQVQPTHLLGARLALLSESVSSNDVGTRLKDVAVPAIVMEPALFDEMGMTGAVWQTDQGDAIGLSTVEVVNATHCLAAGLTGTVTVVQSPSKLVWGNPSNSAAKVARVPGATNAWALFGYETGAAMVSGNAPARRVGVFPGRDTARNLTNDGWRFFDASVTWATGVSDPFKLCGVVPMMLPPIVTKPNS